MTPLRGALISSPKNPLIRETRRALEKASLTDEGWLVIEGPHLLEEAIRSGLTIHHLLLTEEFADTLPPLPAQQSLVTRVLLNELATTEHPQPVIAWVSPPQTDPTTLAGRPGVTLLLDRLQDPGNLGAILRSAEAFGAASILALKGTVGLWNPKVLRASAGSAFRVPYVPGLTLEEARAIAPTPLYFADANAPQALHEINWRTASTIAIGNEGSGISPELRALGTGIRIPTRGVESLNASIAASILLYEASRP